MATVNNVVIPNLTTPIWRKVWALSRALKRAGWKYKGSSDGTTKDVTGDPALDEWGSGQLTAGPLAGAVIGTPARGRALVTGLSGITSADKGKFLAISGSATPANNHYHQIEEYVSATSVKIDARAFAVAADAGPLTWSIYDPVASIDTEYTAFGNGIAGTKCWWCAEGPTIVRIPITAEPTVGASATGFLRGENIVQSGTGFEGEILGYIWYAPTLFGYLVVAPRVRGTGAGRYGLSSGVVGEDITGSASGTTVLATNIGTAVEYKEEIVIWKAASNSTGHQFSGFFDQVADAATKFSALLGSAGCTAAVAPGGGGTGNSFPANACVTKGSDSAGVTPLYWGQYSAQTIEGRGFVIAVDCIEEQYYSQDGSWIWAFANQYGTADGCDGMFYMRLNDTEDGDLHPYAYYTGVHTNTIYTQARTGVGTQLNSTLAQLGSVSKDANTIWWYKSVSIVGFKGWGRYGLASQFFTDLEVAWLTSTERVYAYPMIMGTGDGSVYTYAEKLATQPPYGEIKTRDVIWLVNQNSQQRFRKGSMRWLWAVQGGGRFDLYNSKKYIQLGTGLRDAAGSVMTVGLMTGPWDGSTQQYTE